MSHDRNTERVAKTKGFHRPMLVRLAHPQSAHSTQASPQPQLARGLNYCWGEASRTCAVAQHLGSISLYCGASAVSQVLGHLVRETNELHQRFTGLEDVHHSGKDGVRIDVAAACTIAGANFHAPLESPGRVILDLIIEG